MTDIDERFKDTIFRVEATSFEEHMLWQEWKDRVTWEQESGRLYTTGHVGNRPVATHMRWVLINGCRILFYESTSEVVDYAQVEKWFEKYCNPTWNKGTRKAQCDAMNFHQCIAAINDKLNEGNKK